MKTKMIITGVLLFLLTVTSSALADDKTADESQTTSIKDILTKAFENNPKIKSARARWIASIEKYPQEKALPDPEIMLSVPYDELRLSDGFDSYGVELMQMIPNPRRLSVGGDMAVISARMDEVGYEMTVRDVLVDTMKTYYEIAYLDRAIQIAKKNSDLFAQLSELGKLKSGEGEIGISELYDAETRYAQSQYELNLLMELRESELASMRKLIGADSGMQFGELELPQVEIKEFEIDKIREAVLANNYELEMARLKVDMEKAGVSHVRSMTLPDFKLGLMYDKMETPMTEEETSMGGSDNNFTVKLGLMLPIWGGKNKAAINEAKGMLASSKEKLESDVNSANESVARIYFNLKNTGRLVNLYREIMLPQAVKAEEIAQTFYENGSMPFTQLLETRMIVGNFELALARAETDYLKTLAELRRLLSVQEMGNNSQNSENNGEAK